MYPVFFSTLLCFWTGFVQLWSWNMRFFPPRRTVSGALLSMHTTAPGQCLTNAWETNPGSMQVGHTWLAPFRNREFTAPWRRTQQLRQAQFDLRLAAIRCRHGPVCSDWLRMGLPAYALPSWHELYFVKKMGKHIGTGSHGVADVGMWECVNADELHCDCILELCRSGNTVEAASCIDPPPPGSTRHQE